MPEHPARPFAFSKRERLCSKKVIEQLFASPNRSLAAYPLRAVYMLLPAEEDAKEAPVQLLISVSKRRLRHAVDRNRVKRLVREAYRQNRALLDAPVVLPARQRLVMAVLWLSSEVLPYAVVEQKTRNLLSRIREDLAANGHDEAR